MIHGILAANLKNYIDLSGRAAELTPEKSIFQLSIGRKSKTGWHYIVQDGACQLKRSLYTGAIFIDWNDEFKYKEKSKKQIKQETTPDYEVNFKDEAEFEAFVLECGRYLAGETARRPRVRGSRLSGSKCVCALFDELLVGGMGLQTPSVLKITDVDNVASAARMALFGLAEAFNLLLKDGDATLAAFASGNRRSYFFDTAAGNRGTWLTVQSGLLKVTPNQGTRLPALCGLEFADDHAVLAYVYGGAAEGGSQVSGTDGFDAAYRFKGAATYGTSIDENAVKNEFRACCETALAALRG